MTRPLVIGVLAVVLAVGARYASADAPSHATGSSTAAGSSSAPASMTDLLRGLDTENRFELDAAVSAIERAPTTPELADVLFAAGRACEDRLLDPARALALYDRIVRELPDAGVAIAAQRRIERLSTIRGHEDLAARFAQLVAHADEREPLWVWFEADELSAMPWGGAPDVALWLGDWLCRTHNYFAAQKRYARIAAWWPGSGQALLGARNAVSCALDAHDFTLAKELANALPDAQDVDRAVKSDLQKAADRGLARGGLYRLAWIALCVALVLLLGSLLEASVRGGRRRPALKPPVEVMFLAPLALLIVIVSRVTQPTIAAAVARISIAGVIAAWVSGATLDLLRARGRSPNLRAVLHIVICAVGILAIGYISIARDGLMDMLSETVKYGPGD